MSGRKVFTAGEVLQAADVNDFLMDQSVMVFAGTAARGSAIPSPSEGMVTYLQDSDELQVYTTAWGGVGGGKLVDFKTVTKTDTFSASVAAGGNTAVTGLSITHTLADSANKLIIIAFFGAVASTAQASNVGMAVADDGTLVNIGPAAGSRVSTTIGGSQTSLVGNTSIAFPHMTTVYEPGDTASHTYQVYAINANNATRTLYVNRTESDADSNVNVRTISALHIMEVTA